jgi:hypothetical protein
LRVRNTHKYARQKCKRPKIQVSHKSYREWNMPKMSRKGIQRQE